MDQEDITIEMQEKEKYYGIIIENAALKKRISELSNELAAEQSEKSRIEDTLQQCGGDVLKELRERSDGLKAAWITLDNKGVFDFPDEDSEWKKVEDNLDTLANTSIKVHILGFFLNIVSAFLCLFYNVKLAALDMSYKNNIRKLTERERKLEYWTSTILEEELPGNIDDEEGDNAPPRIWIFSILLKIQKKFHNKKLDKAVKQLNKKVSETEKGKQELASKLEAQKHETEEKIQEVSQLNGQVSDRDKTISQINSELKNKEQTITDLNGQLSDKAKIIDDLNSKLTEKQNTINGLNQQIKGLRKDLLKVKSGMVLCYIVAAICIIAAGVALSGVL